MKIALLSEKYTPDLGGLAISAGRLGYLLASTGHDVRVFAPTVSLPPSEKRILPHNGLNIARFGAHKRIDDTLTDWFELVVEEHKRSPFDILHGYFLSQAGFVAAYAGQYLNIPSVVSIRGNDIERAVFDPSKLSHVMYALQNASAVTTNAKELAKKAKAFYEREIHIIPNGVDIEKFKPIKKNKGLVGAVLSGRNIAGTGAVLGFVGELRKKKGMATLLRGYAQTARERDAVLLIVGEVREGEDKKEFEAFREANPNLKIVVTGQIPHKDLPAYYSLMDAFIHPALRDGMPNAVLEAMACGIPVIATPVGGVLDVIEDGINGRYIPVNDAKMLAKTIHELLDDKNLHTLLSKNARAKIKEKFSLEAELQRNLNLYEKNVAEQAGRIHAN